MTGVMDRSTVRPPDEARGAQELLLDFDAQRGRLRQALREALRSAIQEGRLPARAGPPWPYGRVTSA
jgi:hypothetical protein